MTVQIPIPQRDDGKPDELLMEHMLSAWECAALIQVALRKGEGPGGASSYRTLVHEITPRRLLELELAQAMPAMELHVLNRLQSLHRLLAMGLIEEFTPDVGKRNRHFRPTEDGYSLAASLSLLMEEAGLIVPQR